MDEVLHFRKLCKDVPQPSHKNIESYSRYSSSISLFYLLFLSQIDNDLALEALIKN